MQLGWGGVGQSTAEEHVPGSQDRRGGEWTARITCKGLLRLYQLFWYRIRQPKVARNHVNLCDTDVTVCGCVVFPEKNNNIAH